VVNKPIVFANWERGANDRVSSRVLAKHIGEGGRYSGPFPIMHNVDRMGETLLPRGGETQINTSACPGTILGLCATAGFVGDVRYVAASHPEVLLVACKVATGDTFHTHIGFMVPTDTSPIFQFLVALTGYGPCSFLDLGTHVMAYNGEADCLIRKTLDVGGGTWTATSTGVSVTGAANVNATQRWAAHGVSSQMFVKQTNVWYGPYKISAVGTTTVTLVDPELATYSGPKSAALQAVQVIYVDEIYMDTKDMTTGPTSSPSVSLPVAGNLTGKYQWCYTLETDDAFETNASDWTNITDCTAKAARLSFDVDALTGNLSKRYSKINFYRRGGTLGDTALLVGTLTLDDVNLGANVSSFVLSNGEASGAGTITIRTTGLPTGFPTYGQVVNYNAAGAVIDTASYTGINVDGTTLTGVTGVGATWATASVIHLISFIDDTSDSNLVGRALHEDHDWQGYDALTHAVTAGDRLYAVFGPDPDITDAMLPSGYYRSPSYRIYVSSIESWRYLNNKSPIEVAALDDDSTGGYRDIGADQADIVGLAIGPSGQVIVFKENQTVYSITGSALWSLRVDQLGALPTTDAVNSIVAGDGFLAWKNGAHFWLWDQTQLIDLGDPVRTTLRGISKAYGSGSVGFYRDRRFYLFYPVDANGNTKYVEWDMRYTAPYEAGRTGPSPVTGDGVVANYAAVSVLNSIDGVIYAAKGTDIFAILGSERSGTATYTYAQAGAGNLVVQTPDLPVADGERNAELEAFSISTWASGILAVDADGITYNRRLGGVAATAETASIAAATAAGPLLIYKKATPGARATYLGLKISIPLSTLATGIIARSIEGLTLEVKSEHARLKS
jgi:hypothetical protein